MKFPTMLLVEPTRFRIGSVESQRGRFPSESPRREITIRHRYELGKVPVTFSDWDAAIAAGAPLRSVDDHGWGRDLRPVIDVSWDEARLYLDFLNTHNALTQPFEYRLPTEAEWEYACRAGCEARFSFGDADAKLGDHAWYGYGARSNSGGQTHPVGLKGANAWGFHDFHGNVWEWCEDVWHPDLKTIPRDGSARNFGDENHHVIRGGSWSNSPNAVRSTSRYYSETKHGRNNIGFRIARTVDFEVEVSPAPQTGARGQMLDLSPQLEAVIGTGPMSRIEATRRIWDYIRKANLQSLSDRRIVRLDAALRLVFGEREELSVFDIARLLSNHLHRDDKG